MSPRKPIAERLRLELAQATEQQDHIIARIAHLKARLLAVELQETKFWGEDCKAKHGGLRYTTTGNCVDCHMEAKDDLRARKASGKTKLYNHGLTRITSEKRK